MFFNAKQHAFLISVFKDSMSHIDGDSSLQQSVASSIASQQFIAEGTTIALPQPPYAEPQRSLLPRTAPSKRHVLMPSKDLKRRYSISLLPPILVVE